MVSSLKELIEESELVHVDDPEERFTTSGVSWEIYEALLAKLEDNSHYRVTYLDGVLEIVSPSIRHEKVKKNLAMLLEHFLYRKRINCIPMGSTTFRNKAKKAGAEPDECYCIGEEKSIPDIAIEVNITSGNIDKLETYRRLGVKEVWMWKTNGLNLYHLQEETPNKFVDSYGYERIHKSEFLSALDISLLCRCALITNSLECIDEFEQGLKSDE
ncbi:Uma2 family endonuclease [Iningainema tapete]|uniref:Uma2 family endonuclease n=1 Tax=Iningainema tapete BLCC-T55 TaxID=2748662 RepID=A0A8J6XDI2_9CYAN|nr:Uma2 family endonuclease [Iningainema tapete]MBD2771413.1 Uma2 family endonuclease [Iningainema tapete BLCC-T55]